MFVLSIFMAVICGISIGFILADLIFRKNAAGILRIDQSDPDSEPYLFLELLDNPDNVIMKKRYATFKVDVRNYISHK